MARTSSSLALSVSSISAYASARRTRASANGLSISSARSNALLA